MCFRPAEISAKAECPDCGKKINPVAGVLPKKCPFCGGEGPFEIQDQVSAPSSPASGAPAALKAPGAPTAPKAPGAPAAPKAPGEPGVLGE